MADPRYERVVKDTFGNRPLRTVLMIDDEFPTYSDLKAGDPSGNSKKFRQSDLADALYKSFQNKDMICDIENVSTSIKPERFRKSDLVVLDYHLGPTAGDNEASISILRDLAASNHFNSVIVYTSETNLEQVWLEIIASLSGGWTTLPAELTGEPKNQWDRLTDEGKLPEASLNAVMEFTKRSDLKDLLPTTLQAARKELIDLGVPEDHYKDVLKAMIHVKLATFAGDYAAQPKERAVGGFENDTRWIQSRNVFITILRKDTVVTAPGAPTIDLVAPLERAFLAWKPNIIQIVISEIQNILENEALITADDLLRDPTTQAALCYYLLSLLDPIDPAGNPDVKIPLTNLIDKLIEGLRRRLATDSSLLELASEALLGDLHDQGLTATAWPNPSALVNSAIDISRHKGQTEKNKIFFRLNSFLTTESFRRKHLTTGTIIHNPTDNSYFVIASPACDLTPRQPSPEQIWMTTIAPFKPAIGIKLEPMESAHGDLSKADQGKHIFIELANDMAFRLVAPSSGNPSYESFIVKNNGLYRDEGGRKIVEVGRLTMNATSVDLTYQDFEIIGQLKNSNSNRVLQIAGQYLSRIGMDFIRMPS